MTESFKLCGSGSEYLLTEIKAENNTQLFAMSTISLKDISKEALGKDPFMKNIFN